MSSMSSYFTFTWYKFGLSIQDPSFTVSRSPAAGTLIGGPLGIVLDENTLFGYPFWGSPFTLLCHMLICFGLVFCQWLSVSLLLRLFGNFSFAQELMPEKWVWFGIVFLVSLLAWEAWVLLFRLLGWSD
jgi:hypothetical protein